jgi:hypothetical protein
MSKKIISEKDFRRTSGVKLKTFNQVIKLLRKHFKNGRRGPKRKLSLNKQFLLTLHYWRHYDTFLETGRKFGISESTAWRVCRLIEDSLATVGLCRLPGKKTLLTNSEGSFTLDVTECPIERPKRTKKGRRKNRQKHYYSGKKKRHTFKAQIVVKSRRIQSTSFANGRAHDFKLYKKSKTRFNPKNNVKVDSGYQGLQKTHQNTDLPKKNTKKNPLTKEDKNKNREQASKRVVVEHVIGHIKKFKIISTKYRNRRKRFGLRFNLICSFYNLENSGEL